jgi:hypothetical protein
MAFVSMKGTRRNSTRLKMLPNCKGIPYLFLSSKPERFFWQKKEIL